MYTICNEVESKRYLYCHKTAILSHFKLYNNVGSCCTLAVCRHICIFSQSVNSLFLFDSVMFCSVLLSFFPGVFVVYVSVTFQSSHGIICTVISRFSFSLALFSFLRYVLYVLFSFV